MKWLSILKTTFTCTILAGWLRMTYPLLTWPNFHYLVGKPFKTWLWALWATGMIEVFYFSWAYILPVILYVYTVKQLINNKKLYIYCLIGSIYGSLGYLCGATITNDLWREDQVYALIVLYSFVGVIFGFLYHRWVAGKQFKVNSSGPNA